MADNNEPLYGFWEYDTYPYTISGVIDETKPLHDEYPAARYVTSYGRYFNMMATVRGAKGAKLKEDLEKLYEDRRKADALTSKKYMVQLGMVLASGGIKHPVLARKEKD